MTTTQLMVNLAETTLLVFVVTGLCIRRRAAYCWSFLAYLLVVITVHTSMALRPKQFWLFHVYVVSETVTVVLKILIALEIWLKAFSRFPRARLRVGVLLAVVLFGVAVAARMTPPGLDSYSTFIGVVNPRLQAGTLALYATTVAALAWYRSPVHPLYRAILGGFSVYIIVYTLAMSYLPWDAGWFARQGFVVLVGAAYSGALTWWAWAAWQPLRAPNPIIAQLQPWARSW